MEAQAENYKKPWDDTTNQNIERANNIAVLLNKSWSHGYMGQIPIISLYHRAEEWQSRNPALPVLCMESYFDSIVIIANTENASLPLQELSWPAVLTWILIEEPF